jgi:hypothetical protein
VNYKDIVSLITTQPCPSSVVERVAFLLVGEKRDSHTSVCLISIGN